MATKNGTKRVLVRQLFDTLVQLGFDLASKAYALIDPLEERALQSYHALFRSEKKRGFLKRVCRRIIIICYLYLLVDYMSLPASPMTCGTINCCVYKHLFIQFGRTEIHLPTERYYSRIDAESSESRRPARKSMKKMKAESRES